MVRAALLVGLWLVLVCPIGVRAQQPGAADPGQDVPGDGQRIKEPPPPLFPKHKRGLYRNGQGPTVLDATPQSPPLEIDDPGVPDEGEYEINLATGADLTGDVREFALLLVDVNYGVAPKIRGHEVPTQIKVELPLAGSQASGQPFVAGVGACRVGLKFNVYDNDHIGASVSVYPQLEFAIGGAGSVENGLSEAGQTVYWPLLLRKELSDVTLVVNATVRQPIHDPTRSAAGFMGLGVGRALTRRFVAMTEIRVESAFDLQHDRLIAINVGLMRSLGNSTVLYGNMGRSLFSDDGAVHAFVGMGVKVLTGSAGRVE